MQGRRDNDFNAPGFPIVDYDNFTVVDASVTYRLVRRQSIALAVNNLFDAFYYEKLGLPAAGRVVQAVVSGGFLRVSVGRVLACALLVAAWTRPDAVGAQNVTRGCLETFDPSADYFPDKVTIQDARNFRVEYRKSYKLVTLKEAYAGGPPERYVLSQCGTSVPALAGELAGAQVVRVPATSLFVSSTTHVSLLAGLDRADALAGVSATSGLVIDVERIVAARPALFMSGGAPSASLSVIRSAGVPVVANSEWLEPTALARAEWLKYVAVFLNEERKAESAYGAMRDRYRSLSQRALERPEAERPFVMTGRSTRGVFTIAGGQSYVAALISDAGGRYVWADNTAVGSARVDLEAQIRRAANTDVWINGGGWKDRQAMLQDEPRYVELKAYRQGQVWGLRTPSDAGRGERLLVAKHHASRSRAR